MKRSLTSSPFSQAMRVLAELDIKGGREDHANHFCQELVTPDRSSEWAFLVVALQDGDPLCWLPSRMLTAEHPDDLLDFFERHGINGFIRDAFGSRARIPGDLARGRKGEMVVKTLPIDSFQWQAALASFAEQSSLPIG